MKSLCLGGTARVIDRAQSLGIEVINLTPGNSYGSDTIPSYDHATFLPFACTVFRREHCDTVWCFTEHGLVHGAWIAAMMGVSRANPPVVVEATRHKTVMRQILSHQGDLSWPWDRVKTASDITLFVEKFGPSVVKPCHGTGSERVSLVSTETAPQRIGDWIIEQFIPGEEYSAEGFCQNGNFQLVALTAKRSDQNFVEMGHIMPAKQLVSDDVVPWLSMVHRALGIQWGPTHTEFKWHSGRFIVVETHTRPGGDRITELVHLTTGIDLVKWHMCQSLDLPYSPDSPSAHAAAIRFFDVTPGRLSRVEGVDRVSNHPQVTECILPSIGQQIAPRTGSTSRAGHFIVVGDSPDEVSALCDELENQVVFTVEEHI